MVNHLCEDDLFKRSNGGGAGAEQELQPTSDKIAQGRCSGQQSALRACRAVCRYEEAAGPAGSATAMLDAELGPGNANVATSLLLEAAVALCSDRAAFAQDCAERALDIRVQVHGSGSKEAAAAMCTLADALRDAGR